MTPDKVAIVSSMMEASKALRDLAAHQLDVADRLHNAIVALHDAETQPALRVV